MKLTTLLGCLIFMSLKPVLAQDTAVGRFPVVVSFHSICCGVPSDSTITSYILAFKKKNKLKSIKASHIGPMGKEGEYHLAFTLKGLSKKQAKAFIAGLKKVKKLPGETGEISFMDNYSLHPAKLPGRASVREVIF